jgi:hypothetical protein
MRRLIVSSVIASLILIGIGWANKEIENKRLYFIGISTENIRYTLNINGFEVYTSEESGGGCLISRYLKRGENRLVCEYEVIEEKKEEPIKSSLAIEIYIQYKDDKGIKRRPGTIMEWKIEAQQDRGDFIKTFMIEDFPFEWSWERSLPIKELTEKDRETILKKAEEYIKADEALDAVKVVEMLHLANEEARIAHYKPLKSKEEMVRSLKEAFDESYPGGPVEPKRFEGRLIAEVSPYNNRLVKVYREGNEPLYDIGSRLGFRTMIYKIYFIRLDSGWEIIKLIS